MEAERTGDSDVSPKVPFELSRAGFGFPRVAYKPLRRYAQLELWVWTSGRSNVEVTKTV